jgi:hypothetical protein
VRIGKALKELHASEQKLANDYRAVGDRHSADQDVFHICHVLAEQCDEHLQKLEGHLERYGERTGKAAASIEPSGGLLDDLVALFLAAEDASIRWVMAGQGAQAARDQELLDVVTECHTETQIQVKWAETRIKIASPQELVSG